MLPHQTDEVRNCSKAMDAAEHELQKLRDRRTQMFEIENMIRSYSDRVDIEGYTLKSQIARVIEWAKSGKYSKG